MDRQDSYRSAPQRSRQPPGRIGSDRYHRYPDQRGPRGPPPPRGQPPSRPVQSGRDPSPRRDSRSDSKVHTHKRWFNVTHWDEEPTAGNRHITLYTSGVDKPSRRLYVGSLDPSVTPLELKDLFRGALIRRGCPRQQPVFDVKVNSGYAFIEFVTPEDATKAMGLDGIRLHGRSLLVKRPKDYVAPTTDVNTHHIDDGPGKVFVGGIPPEMTEDSFKAFLARHQLPTPSQFQLMINPVTGLSRGYAFMRFDTSVDTLQTDVVDKLHGLSVGSNRLRVELAQSSSQQLPGKALEARIAQEAGEQWMDQLPAVGHSKVVAVLNALRPWDLTARQRVSEVVGELWEAAEAAAGEGAVVEALVSRCTSKRGAPNFTDDRSGALVELEGLDTSSRLVHGEGIIFMSFTTHEASFAALKALGGTTFYEHTLVTCFFNEQAFAKREFSDDGFLPVSSQLIIIGDDVPQTPPLLEIIK
eukprot:gnl/Dysnectes_brevis/2523_a3028_989.p1 GENE.gnl/Dysnectes_brevis/2523_a3028_989~~gnl/Dysnectes_brevis/2523_a3028_989.p1  ORF type:complete len:486 (-),score=139.10 gnl/Dysnectes_brevis/2523_a3028_989:92-1501(-)